MFLLQLTSQLSNDILPRKVTDYQALKQRWQVAISQLVQWYDSTKKRLSNFFCKVRYRSLKKCLRTCLFMKETSLVFCIAAV